MEWVNKLTNWLDKLFSWRGLLVGFGLAMVITVVLSLTTLLSTGLIATISTIAYFLTTILVSLKLAKKNL